MKSICEAQRSWCWWSPGLCAGTWSVPRKELSSYFQVCMCRCLWLHESFSVKAQLHYKNKISLLSENKNVQAWSWNRSSPNIPFATSFYSYKGFAHVSRGKHAMGPYLEWKNPLHIDKFSIETDIWWQWLTLPFCQDPGRSAGSWQGYISCSGHCDWLSRGSNTERLGGFVFNHHWEPIRRTRYHAATEMLRV